MLDVLITGYPSIDHIFKVDRAPQPGETGTILDAHGLSETTCGGCAANIAVACSRLGLSAGVVIVLGEDQQGQYFKEALMAQGVHTERGVHFAPSGLTPHTFLFVDSANRHQTFFYSGVSGREDVELLLDDSLAKHTRYGVITVGNVAHNRKVAEWLSRHEVPILWSLKNDPKSYPPNLVHRLLDLSHFLVMNEAEGSSLQDMLGLSSPVKLLDRGIKFIIITMGSEGSRVLQGGSSTNIPAVQPRILVDPTGAGDAYVSGLMFGLCRGLPIEIGARTGAVMASFVLESWGCQAGLPDEAQLFERYRQAFGESPVV